MGKKERKYLPLQDAFKTHYLAAMFVYTDDVTTASPSPLYTNEELHYKQR